MCGLPQVVQRAGTLRKLPIRRDTESSCGIVVAEGRGELPQRKWIRRQEDHPTITFL